ncbi:ActD-like protein [Corallococcus sp. H22C18031201]|uniref:ActD-like protein n=1 Tax=Citreicoccus inhibens TaxID=2849499 RepID=UPI000E73DCDB|nr:ActD-like protein [Citreicoccus inhibens]MBU8899996.1 ActD-like protein [Citreicoccus inhibens]RJS20040.1 ActD-like protein [Corallococcus sp. H22C18031201]
MTSPQRTPDWLLERIALGDLPPAELAAAKDRLAREPDGAARLAALEADNRVTLEKLPPEAVAREVKARAERSARVEAARRDTSRPLFRFGPVLGLVPVLAAMALFVLVRPEALRGGAGAGGGVSGDVPEVTRIKGLTPQLVVHRQGAGAPERLDTGAHAVAGDVVQLAYVAAGRGHGLILSVDGRGAVTRHLPESGAASAVLEPSARHSLSGAYELDDAPGFERFFLITSAEPFELEPVLAAARALVASPEARTGALALPEGLEQTSFLLEKPAQ